MNVIWGADNLALIADKHTTLELDTLLVSEEISDIQYEVPHYAVIGPGDIPLENFIRLKQFIPVHEALMKNYKQGNWDFCVDAIEKLMGNIDPFMDSFYDIMLSRMIKETENPTENWTSVVDVSK